MERKKSASSRRAKRQISKGKPTSGATKSELAALFALRDEDINTSDAPEVEDWSKAVVGKFYRPLPKIRAD